MISKAQVGQRHERRKGSPAAVLMTTAMERRREAVSPSFIVYKGRGMVLRRWVFQHLGVWARGTEARVVGPICQNSCGSHLSAPRL
jgi:hypothetical protein